MSGDERPAAAAGAFRLGDRTVNRLGFGAMRLTGSAAMGHGEARDPEQSAAVLRRARELGVDHIDTAAFYSAPHSSANAIIRAALAPYDDDLTIVTKVGPRRDDAGEWLPWARPDQLRENVERNLVELGCERLDVVNYRHGGKGPVTDHVAALAALRDEGLLGHVGLSNVTLPQLEEALQVTDVVCVQNRHAAGYEREDTGDLLAACADLAIAFVPFFTIAGRSRESAAEEDERVVREIAEAHGSTPAQVRIAWTLALGPHVLAIPGTGDPAHLEQNVAAAALRLTDDELAGLASLSAA